MSSEIQKAKADLLRKYPHATMSKFEFYSVTDQNGKSRVEIYFRNSDIISTDITSTTFKNDKSMWVWLHNNVPFPKIWNSGGTVQKLPLTESAGYGRDIVRYPPYTLNYSVSDFDVFVDDVNSFKSNLPKIVIDTKLRFEHAANEEATDGGSMVNTVWTLTKSYYQAITALYIATYRSGVSLQNLTASPDVPKQITSLMKFHVYFTMRRVMFRLNKSKADIADIIRLYVPDYRVLKSNLPLGGNWLLDIKDIQGDYKRYCSRTSNGITELGQELLNQSIEVYVYALLGAQAKSKQSIVGSRASAREVQQVFRNIVEDAVVQYSPSVWINLMNKAIKDTHVKLDMAVTPNTWLIPRSMVLLKKPIPGYNNLLRESTATNMVFGFNSKLNFESVSKKPVKTHASGGEHLESLDNVKTTPPTTSTTPAITPPATSEPVTDNSKLFSVSLILLGVIVSKFVM